MLFQICCIQYWYHKTHWYFSRVKNGTLEKNAIKVRFLLQNTNTRRFNNHSRILDCSKYDITTLTLRGMLARDVTDKQIRPCLHVNFQPVFANDTFDLYRPQRSCDQGNVFTGVCHSFCSRGGRVSASVHAGIPPSPQIRQTPPRTRQAPPLDQADPPGPGRQPPREADSSIRSTSGRYASYWNAFLFWHILTSYVNSTIGMHSTHFKMERKTVQKTLCVNQTLADCPPNYHRTARTFSKIFCTRDAHPPPRV